MKFAIGLLIVLSASLSFGQDTITLENHKGKTYELTLPTYGGLELKSGEKMMGMLQEVSNEKIVIRTITEDEGTIREAKKNRILSEEERNDMLYIHEKQYPKGDVEEISVVKKRGHKETSMKKAGIYTLMGLTVAAGIGATIQDVKNDQFPFIAVGGAVIIGVLFLMLHKTSSKKFNFYKWKIR